MSVKRNHAASVVLSNNTLRVTGGFDQACNVIKTTAIVTKDVQTSQGPNLPLALSRHAIVALNRGVFILIGGSSDDGLSSTTYFYEEKKGWRPGPNLKNARLVHTAGVLTDRVSTKQYIAAVGGYNGNEMRSVEYLEYPGSNEWMEGKPTHSTLDKLESHPFLF